VLVSLYTDIQNFRFNRQITVPELRVLDAEGNHIGIMSRDEAFKLAQDQKLDIIEISPNATPPVAKIMDYDKYRYQLEKAQRKQRAAQKSKGLKQVQITPRAALNDLQVKARKIDEFLEEGHNVGISLFLRGREKYNRDWSMKKLKEFMELIKTPHIVTMPPKPGGRGFITQIAKKPQ